MNTAREATDAVAVRLRKSLIKTVDERARDAGRTRSNYLARLIDRTVDDRLLLRILETIIDGIRRDESRGGDSYAEEFERGQLHAAKWVISALLGESRKDHLLHAIRQGGRPIPHVVGRFEDGTRPGFDTDAG